MADFLSVSEYAKLKGKDPGNIRRLLASGRLEGQKVGKQWIIPENAVYPVDRRETTGEYRNWRKKPVLNLNNELSETLCNMVKELYSIYGGMMYDVILYGSYARGTQTEESDVDIAVFLLSKPDGKTTDEMLKCVSSYELKCGKVLSVIDIDYDRYMDWKNTLPFYKNISKEGISLWKKAM